MMDVVLVPFLLTLKAVIGLAVWVVVADVIIGWLYIAGIFNPNNRFVVMIADTLSKLSEFMLSPIRRYVPCMVGVMDLSPIVLILGLTFFENVITRILMKMI